MDINDISINSLIRDAAAWQDVDYVTCGIWQATCDTFTMSVDTRRDSRNVRIEDEETCLQVVFQHIWPKQFDALCDALHIER